MRLELHGFYSVIQQSSPSSSSLWNEGLFAFSMGPKGAYNGLKMGLFHPFVHPKWSRMDFGKRRC